MSNVAFKLVFFTFMLNIATGLVFATMPFLNDGSDLSMAMRGDLDYKSEYADQLVTDMNGSLNPSGLAEDRGDEIYRVIDIIGLGFIQRAYNWLMDYLCGFVVLLESLTRGYFVGELAPLGEFLFHRTSGGSPVGALHLITVVMYVLAAFQLVSGRNLVQDG